MSTNTARIAALETAQATQGADIAEIKAGMAALIALLSPEAPARVTPEPAPAKADPKAEAFVGWLKETAEARHARKASNSEMAAWMRSKGIHAGGSAWAACKAGERNVRTLKALNRKDAKARA